MRKTSFATQSSLHGFPYVQILVNSKFFKLSLNLSLTYLRAQIACYELKGDLSPVMLKEIFHDSFENFEITRICMENHASVTGWQKLFSSYKCFQLSAAVTIATFEIYGWKFSGCLILICPSVYAKWIFRKVNCFRVYRKLITWSSHAKSPIRYNQLALLTKFGRFEQHVIDTIK